MQNRIYILNNSNSPRLSPELGQEIGLNESIILLQLDFWISIGPNERDGRHWTYQSLSGLAKAFPFWGKETINRAIKSLESQGLVTISDKYNQESYDKTRWFSINYGACNSLNSITIRGYESNPTQNESTLSQTPVPKGNDPDSYPTQNESGLTQNESTIPEIREEEERKRAKRSLVITSEAAASDTGASVSSGPQDTDFGSNSEWNSSGPQDVVLDDDFFGTDETEGQPKLMATSVPSKANGKPKGERIAWGYYVALYTLCFSVSDPKAINALAGSSKGRTHNTLTRLHSAGADLNLIPGFRDWWEGFWQSREKSGQYVPPTPEKVLEHWWTAMASLEANKPQAPEVIEKVVDEDFIAAMKRRAEERK